MAMLDHTLPTFPESGPRTLLQGPPSQWPREATEAYWSVLRDLNAWCRETGSSPSTNALVAEEAVREAWAVASPPQRHAA